MIQLPSNLHQLRAAWRAAEGVTASETCFRLVNAATPKLYVHGMIGGDDSDATEFVQAVHGINAKTIDLHINSPGGFVWDALSMFEALRSHPATVNTHVDGVAGSAASFLALAGDDVETAKGSRWMIHDAAIAAAGTPAELRELADLGDAVSDDIAGIYADRAGGTSASWRKAMSATTWYSAEQAVDAKLADRVTGGKNKNSGPDNRTRLIQARHRALTTQGG